MPAKAPPWFGSVHRGIGGLGAGGQVAFADPASKVSVGFVRNAMTSKPDLSNQVISALYSCLDRR